MAYFRDFLSVLPAYAGVTPYWDLDELRRKRITCVCRDEPQPETVDLIAKEYYLRMQG